MLRAEWARGKYSWFPVLFLPTIILWSKVWNYKKFTILYFISADDHSMIEGLKLQTQYTKMIFHFCRRSFYDRRFEITNPIYKITFHFCRRSFYDRRFEITNWNYEHNISFLPTIIFMIEGLKFEFEKCTLCPKHIIWRGQIVPQTYNANVIFCQRSIRLTVWKSLEHKSSRDRIVFFGNQLSI